MAFHHSSTQFPQTAHGPELDIVKCGSNNVQVHQPQMASSNDARSLSSRRSGLFNRTHSLPTVKLRATRADGAVSETAGNAAVSRKAKSSTSTCPPANRKTYSLRSSSRSNQDSDDSDDEHNFHIRLGGCIDDEEVLPRRDDSNKENVAPMRRLSESILHSEALAYQEDALARRTRRFPPAPMSDRSDSVPGTPRQGACRPFRRTISSPLTRKRAREMHGGEEDEDNAASGLSSPTSRLRLDLCTDDTESCYFSSQGASSLFEMASQSSPLSRCTTPDPCSDDDTKTDVGDPTVSCDESTRHYSNIFNHARTLLRYGRGSDIQVVGRERERSALQRFLQRRFGLFRHMEQSAAPNGEAMAPEMDGASNSGSLYICGLPGTGKTALVRSILKDIDSVDISTDKLQVAFIDCMGVQHPRQLFRCILEALHGRLDDLPSGDQGDHEAERRVLSIIKDPEHQV